MYEVHSYDPGETTGYAVWLLDEGKCQFAGASEIKGVAKFRIWLRKQNPRHIVCENFRLWPQMGQQLMWSTFPAVRVIGSIEMFADLNGAVLHMQNSDKKTIGAMYAGLTYPTGKNTHWPNPLSAQAHGWYWLSEAGLWLPT